MRRLAFWRCVIIGSMPWCMTAHCYCGWFTRGSPTPLRCWTQYSTLRSTRSRYRKAANCAYRSTSRFLTPSIAIGGARLCSRTWDGADDGAAKDTKFDHCLHSDMLLDLTTVRSPSSMASEQFIPRLGKAGNVIKESGQHCFCELMVR